MLTFDGVVKTMRAGIDGKYTTAYWESSRRAASRRCVGLRVHLTGVLNSSKLAGSLIRLARVDAQATVLPSCRRRPRVDRLLTAGGSRGLPCAEWVADHRERTCWQRLP